MCLRQYSAVSASSYATREILLSDFVTPNATSLEPLSGDFLVFRTLLSVYAQYIVLTSTKINHRIYRIFLGPFIVTPFESMTFLLNFDIPSEMWYTLITWTCPYYFDISLLLWHTIYFYIPLELWQTLITLTYPYYFDIP